MAGMHSRSFGPPLVSGFKTMAAESDDELLVLDHLCRNGSSFYHARIGNEGEMIIP